MNENNIPLISIVFGFLGTLIGGAITIASNWLSYYWQSRKDADQWEREKELEAKREQRDLDLRVRMQKEEILRNCLHYVPLHIVDFKSKGDGYNSEVYLHLDSSLKWISELLLFFDLSDHDRDSAEAFLQNPLEEALGIEVLAFLRKLAVQFRNSNS